MRCPNCDGQVLKIEILFQGFVTAFFHNAENYQLTEPVTMNSSWEDESPCICETCHWEGRVAEALARCLHDEFEPLEE
jgi:hypothetical protein